jgi:GNAT superfamily N-acetyltransferase
MPENDSDPRIRKAQLADAEALAALILGLGQFGHHFAGLTEDGSRRRVARLLELCLSDTSHSIYIAGGATGGLVGYVAVHWLPYLFLPGPEGFVSELFVAEAASGLGIGSRLLQAVVQEAQTRGCSRLSLLNMRDRESYERGFYAKQGWQERPDAANFILRLPSRAAE